MITKEQVEKALDDLEVNLSKASEQDLDQPEGADMGQPVKEKMSDMAKKKEKEDDLKKMKTCKSEYEEDGEEESEPEMEKMKNKKHDLKKMKKGLLEAFDKEEEGDKKMKAKKSFHDLPEEVETKIDVSDFLKSLVEHTADSIDGIAEVVAKSQTETVESYNALAGAVEDIQASQAKIGIVLKALCERVGVIENSPATTARAETVAKSDNEVTERVFKSGLEEEKGEEPMFKSLSENPHVAKSQISNALCDLVKSGKATDMDVIGFESSSYIRPEIVTELKTILN